MKYIVRYRTKFQYKIEKDLKELVPNQFYSKEIDHKDFFTWVIVKLDLELETITYMKLKYNNEIEFYNAENTAVIEFTDTLNINSKSNCIKNIE